MKHYLIALSIFSLALSFVIGSWLISNAVKDEPSYEGNTDQTPQLFTQEEVAKYLGLRTEEVQKLTENPTGANSYTSEIPHIKIEDKAYYPKTAIDRWLLNIELTVVN